MNLRSAVLVGALVLGGGCARDSSPFLGTYAASGEVTTSLFGSTAVQPRSEILRIIEGRDADILISDGRGCVLPAEVEALEATLVPDSSCRETVLLPDGSSVTGSVLVTRGSATRSGEAITLRYEGTLRVPYEETTQTALVSSTMTLTPAVP